MKNLVFVMKSLEFESSSLISEYAQKQKFYGFKYLTSIEEFLVKLLAEHISLEYFTILHSLMT